MAERPDGPTGMRILVWSPDVGTGGAERLLVPLVRALAEHPAVEHVTLAAPADSFRADRRAPLGGPRLELVDLSGVGGGLRVWLRTDGRVFGIRGTGRIRRVLRRSLLNEAVGGPDRSHEAWLRSASRHHDVVYAFWAHLRPRPSTAAPLVCTIQDTTLLDYPEMLGAEATAAEITRTEGWLREAADVVVSSNATRNALIRRFGRAGERAVVVPHAIVPSAPNGTGSSPADIGVRLPPRYLVFPSCLARHKNHETLLVAWARLAARQEVGLVFFGGATEFLNDPLPRVEIALRLTSLMRRLDLVPGRDVFALGYIPHAAVLPLIQGAEALIMPSLAEGGGSFPVEEALSLGVPVLCSDIPVMREHLLGRTARIGWFDPLSPDSIAAAVEDLFARYPEYKASAERAMHDPRGGWDEVAGQYVKVFESAIARRQP